MTTSVWAEARDVPGKVCNDASLGGGRTPADHAYEYPKGSKRGQAGWEIGIQFQTLDDLSNRLSAIRKQYGLIRRLAIHSHGQMNGVVFLEGRLREQQALRPTNLRDYRDALNQIAASTTPEATILFMGCIAGLGEGGADLVKNLSRDYWQGRTVVAFKTVGVVDAVLQERDPGCNEPGMRDSGVFSPTEKEIQAKVYGKRWDNLDALPWQSEQSPSATVAVQGKLLSKSPETIRHDPQPWWLDKDLYTAWNEYIAARATGKSAQLQDALRTRFQVIKAARDRKGIEYSGEFGPDEDAPPWKYEMDAIKKVRREKRPVRIGR